ncbi:NAD(P)H-dependent oxidoreductase [Massilia sp. ST3]|uniref:NAD(P)H-dependent oxidoreductase n=1 Tax=Massilia sp. ST3 TaxID=2824903 RepID=UPI001B834C3E|nr:NAD(P)H-dependent oxidoreductase [Massilia sp. ST3]MBQ5949201.1 NAD(P)H-dependent oxidoreductase [Massilia sp. ST3]
MSPSPRALVVFADPALHRSRISRRVGEAARSLPDVVVQDLYELYPDLYVDVRRERALLKEADLVVFAFQLSWYAMPALLKEWFDTVFKPEWTGPGERARLAGKSCWAAVGCASQPGDYRPGGRHGRPLADYLAPLEQSARACGMRWIEPHVFYGAEGADAQAVDAHAAQLRALLAGHLERLALEGVPHGA